MNQVHHEIIESFVISEQAFDLKHKSMELKQSLEEWESVLESLSFCGIACILVVSEELWHSLLNLSNNGY